MNNLIYSITVCALLNVLVTIIFPEGKIKNLCVMITSLYLFYSVVLIGIDLFKNFALFHDFY